MATRTQKLIVLGIVVGGTIVSLGNGSFILQPKGHPNKPERPPLTVELDGSTVVSKQGQAVGLEAIAEGADVIVSGTRTTPETVLATKLIVRAA